jgi:hypothetical protein
MIAGKTRDLLGPKNEDLVEFGVARFVDIKDIRADEPIALLAAANYFSDRSPWTLEHFLIEGVGSHDGTIRGKGLEPVAAYLLGNQFPSLRPLSNIFTFANPDDPLRHRKGRLVALQRVDGKHIPISVDLTSPNQGATWRLGCSPRSSSDFGEWLYDPDRLVFCFPAIRVGPDFILALLLDDGTLLWVVVQVKHYTQDKLTPGQTTAAFKKTSPSLFTSESRTQEVCGVQFFWILS